MTFNATHDPVKVKDELVALLLKGAPLPILGYMDDAMKAAGLPAYREWRESGTRSRIQLNLLILATLAGSPPSLKEIPDAELAELLAQHLRTTSVLQANMRKQVKILLHKASRAAMESHPKSMHPKT